jgi:hypothetical protein
MRLPNLNTLLCTLVFTLASAGLAHADIQFTGTTSGPATLSTSPLLTFVGGSINTLIPVGGGAALTNLGTFTLTPNCSGRNCNQAIAATPFTLSVNFTLPTVAGSPQTFTASFSGTVSRNGNSSNFNSSVSVDFNNTIQSLSYSTAGGTGTFGLKLNDLTFGSSSSSSPQTGTLSGAISNVTFTPTNNSGTTAPVPEPGSVVLFGTVAGAIALGIRRRKKA